MALLDYFGWFLPLKRGKSVKRWTIYLYEIWQAALNALKQLLFVLEYQVVDTWRFWLSQVRNKKGPALVVWRHEWLVGDHACVSGGSIRPVAWKYWLSEAQSGSKLSSDSDSAAVGVVARVFCCSAKRLNWSRRQALVLAWAFWVGIYLINFVGPVGRHCQLLCRWNLACFCWFNDLLGIDGVVWESLSATICYLDQISRAVYGLLQLHPPSDCVLRNQPLYRETCVNEWLMTSSLSAFFVMY